MAIKMLYFLLLLDKTIPNESISDCTVYTVENEREFFHTMTGCLTKLHWLFNG